jgi:hypothetical protein
MQGSYEFRCFVREGVLVGVSQRDCANFYEFLLDEKQQVTCSAPRDTYRQHSHPAAYRPNTHTTAVSAV